jgi:hypothetical protein
MLKVPWRATTATRSANALRSAGRPGAWSPKRSRSCCSRKQKARSLSVLPTGRIRAVQHRIEILQVAVVGEHPVAAPHLAHEGMAVFQRHLALRGLADVGDDVQRFDRIALDQFGDRRGDGGLVIDEVAHAGAFEKGDAPAIVVGIGAAAAVGEAGKTEHNVSRDIAVHGKKLTHGPSLPCAGAKPESGAGDKAWR